MIAGTASSPRFLTLSDRAMRSPFASQGTGGSQVVGRRKGRIFPLQLRGDLLREVEDRGVPDEVGEDEVRDPRLAHAGEVAGAADPEVFLRDPEAVDGPSP